MNKIIVQFCFLIFITIASAIVITAQTPTLSPTPDDEPDFIVPARPTASNPAEFQKPGVLQLELGYNANFHATGTRLQQDMPMALRFAVNRRILLEFDGDSPYSQTDTSKITTTGTGDSQLGIQFVLQPEKETQPAVSFAYYVKVPTAHKQLGTGRVDHNFIGLVSKTIGKTTVDFNAIYLLAGRTSERGHSSSGQAALAVTESLTKRFGIQGEISSSSRNDQQSGAMFGLGVVTYQFSKRVVFDSGVRFGLTPDAPRVGIIAGITVGIANLYKKRH